MSALVRRMLLPSPDAPVVGALDLAPGEAGVRPRRLPAWTRPRIADPLFAYVVGVGSGVRIATRTRATAIALELVVIGLDPGAGRARPAVVELLVDGVPVASRGIVHEQQTLVELTGATTQRGEAVRIVFDGLPPGHKDVELWLPHTTAMELVALSSDEPLHPPIDARPVWLHHGSSISQGGEADQPTGTWPAVAARAAGVHLRSLGFAGNAVGDPWVARTMRDLPADLISVEIGINVINGDLMRRRMFESVLHGFLDTLRDGHPETPLTLLGPIPCPTHDRRPGPTRLDEETGVWHGAGDVAELDRGALDLPALRAALESVLAARDDDPALHYLDGRMLLPEDEVDDLPDGLHPNSAAHARMGERFAHLVLSPSA